MVFWGVFVLFFLGFLWVFLWLLGGFFVVLFVFCVDCVIFVFFWCGLSVFVLLFIVLIVVYRCLILFFWRFFGQFLRGFLWFFGDYGGFFVVFFFHFFVVICCDLCDLCEFLIFLMWFECAFSDVCCVF